MGFKPGDKIKLKKNIEGIYTMGIPEDYIHEYDGKELTVEEITLLNHDIRILESRLQVTWPQELFELVEPKVKPDLSMFTGTELIDEIMRRLEIKQKS